MVLGSTVLLLAVVSTPPLPLLTMLQTLHLLSLQSQGCLLRGLALLLRFPLLSVFYFLLEQVLLAVLPCVWMLEEACTPLSCGKYLSITRYLNTAGTHIKKLMMLRRELSPSCSKINANG